MFGDIPELVQKYFMPDIVDITGKKEWPVEARTFCEELVLNKQCIIETIKDAAASYEQGAPCKLVIYTKDKSLADALRNNGLIPKIQSEPL